MYYIIKKNDNSKERLRRSIVEAAKGASRSHTYKSLAVNIVTPIIASKEFDALSFGFLRNREHPSFYDWNIPSDWYNFVKNDRKQNELSLKFGRLLYDAGIHVYSAMEDILPREVMNRFPNECGIKNFFLEYEHLILSWELGESWSGMNLIKAGRIHFSRDLRIMLHFLRSHITEALKRIAVLDSKKEAGISYENNEQNIIAFFSSDGKLLWASNAFNQTMEGFFRLTKKEPIPNKIVSLIQSQQNWLKAAEDVTFMPPVHIVRLRNGLKLNFWLAGVSEETTDKTIVVGKVEVIPQLAKAIGEKLSVRQADFVEAIMHSNPATYENIAELVGTSTRNVAKHIAKMKKQFAVSDGEMFLKMLKSYSMQEQKRINALNEFNSLKNQLLAQYGKSKNFYLDSKTPDKDLNKILLGKLSMRQKECIAFLSEGLSIGKIAHKMALSEWTVRKHIQKTYPVMGVSSLRELKKKLV